MATAVAPGPDDGCRAAPKERVAEDDHDARGELDEQLVFEREQAAHERRAEWLEALEE